LTSSSLLFLIFHPANFSFSRSAGKTALLQLNWPKLFLQFHSRLVLLYFVLLFGHSLSSISLLFF
jgi:hypothetical protein